MIVESVQFHEEINLFGMFTSQLGAKNQQPQVALELADRGVKIRFGNGSLKGKTILVPYARISGVMLADEPVPAEAQIQASLAAAQLQRQPALSAQLKGQQR